MKIFPVLLFFSLYSVLTLAGESASSAPEQMDRQRETFSQNQNEGPPTLVRVEQEPKTEKSVEFKVEWTISPKMQPTSFEAEICAPGCSTMTTYRWPLTLSFLAPYYVNCTITMTAIYRWGETRQAAVFFQGMTIIGRPSSPQILTARQQGNELMLSWQAPLHENSPRIWYDVFVDSDNPSVGHREMRTITDSLNVSLAYFDPPSDFYRVNLTAFTKNEEGKDLRGPSVVRSYNYQWPEPPTNYTVIERKTSSIYLRVVPPVSNSEYIFQFSVPERNISRYSRSGHFYLEGLKTYEFVTFEVKSCLLARKNICGKPLRFKTSSNVGRPMPVSSLKGELNPDGGLLFSWQPPKQPAGPLDGYILEVTSPGRKETWGRRLPSGATSILYFPSTGCDDYECSEFQAEISAFNEDLQDGTDWISVSRFTAVSIPQSSGAWLTPTILVFSVVVFVAIIGVGYFCSRQIRRQNG